MSSEKENEARGQSSTDITAFVQTLLNQMQSRFNQMQDGIVTKLEEMGHRIDTLEQSISDLIEQAGVDGETEPEGELQEASDEPKINPDPTNSSASVVPAAST